MIEINNVSFAYTHDSENSLKNINLKINDGEFILLCGKSGCGKTTITKLINGIIPHICEDGNLIGTVNVNNLDIATSEIYEISREVGSVFQNPKSQFFNLNSDAELCFGLENNGISKEKMIKSLNQTIKNLNIENLLHRNIFNMSGGEKQRLAFASVSATNPKILVLDEPSANLDIDSIQLLKEQLKTAKRQGKTIIISEHRLWFLRDIIDRAVFIDNGKIKKTFNRLEFLSLTVDMRYKMGLRDIENQEIQIKKFDTQGQLSVQGLNIGYKNRVISKNINFYASQHQILTIVGKNGTGKSTLLRTLCGLQKSYGGIISLNGKKLTNKQRQRETFMVMQDVNHQLFTDSVWNECLISKNEIDSQQITTVLSDFDLLEFKDTHPMALSGGQKQRLAIATAVLSDKKIILFDEPTSGLDYLHMRQVANYINTLSTKKRIIIVVTHDNEFINKLNTAIYNF